MGFVQLGALLHVCPDVIRLFLFSVINSNSHKGNARITKETHTSTYNHAQTAAPRSIFYCPVYLAR